MIIKSSQYKLQVKPLHREEAVVYRVGGGGGEFAQGSPGSWGQGWCSQAAGARGGAPRWLGLGGNVSPPPLRPQ